MKASTTTTTTSPQTTNNNTSLLVKKSFAINRPKISQQQDNIIIDNKIINKRAMPDYKNTNSNIKLMVLKKTPKNEPIGFVAAKEEKDEDLSKTPVNPPVFFDNDGYDDLYDLHKTIVCECNLPMKKMQNKSTKQGFWVCQRPYGSPENCKKTLSVKNALLQVNGNNNNVAEQDGPITSEIDLFPPHYKTIVDNQVLYHTQVHFPNYTLSEQTNDISKIIQPTVAPITIDFIAYVEKKSLNKINWIKYASCADRDYNYIDFRINFLLQNDENEEEVQISYKIVENTNLKVYPDKFLVPLHGIAPNDEGWLYGNSEIIVIRKFLGQDKNNNKWLMIPRLKLKNWIVNNIKKSTIDNNNNWKIKKIFPNNEYEKHIAVPWEELETFALNNNYYNLHY